MDLEAISQRIMQVAQAAVAEHVAAIGRSQADGLLELVNEMEEREANDDGLGMPAGCRRYGHSNRMRF